MAIKVFDPTKIIVTVGGVALEDMSADDAVSVEYSGDVFTFSKGLNGKLAATVNPDKSGTITVNVLQESDNNKQLHSLTGVGTSKVNTKPITITITNALTNKRVVTAANCWLTGAPSISFGSEAGTCQWKFTAESFELQF